jgi:RNA polymerase sigma-70 factor (ECF subfamily)
MTMTLTASSAITLSRPGLAALDGAAEQPDDLELISSLARGNSAALDPLYLRYRKAAFACAYALLRDAGEAEDAVHDAFLRVWRAAASYRPERGAPRGWLMTIFRNTALDLLRARQTARRHQPGLAHHAAIENDDDIATTVAFTAEARRVRAALGELPMEQRHALELAYFAGLTHTEIARQTGAPLGTVKGRVRLALRRLRVELGDLDPTIATVPRAATCQA